MITVFLLDSAANALHEQTSKKSAVKKKANGDTKLLLRLSIHQPGNTSNEIT